MRKKVKLVEHGIAFTWSDRKEEVNFRKHGVRFAEAVAAFFDDNAVFEFNSVDNYMGEERLDVIGMVYGHVTYMVYVDRVTVDNEDVIRIISARKATKGEENIYYDNGNP